jgi:long-subunit fatty acid transport protein
MKKQLISLLAVILIQGFAFAQTSSRVPAAFVDVGIGARPAAMGSAFTGLADDIHSLFWNPAGLAEIKSKQATFNTAKVFGLINYNMVSVGLPVHFTSEKEGLGVAVISSGDDALTEFTALVGYSRYIGPVSIGLNVKYRHASFGKNSLSRDDYKVFSDQEFSEGGLNQVTGDATGFGADLGIMFAISEKIKMGLMVRDAIAPVSWKSEVKNTALKTKGNYSESVPFETIIGTSYQVFDVLLVTADYQPSFTRDVFNIIRGGAELKLFDHLFLRAGLQNIVNKEDDERFVMGAGFSFNIKGWTVLFDYTHLLEALDNSNRITLGIGF